LIKKMLPTFTRGNLKGYNFKTLKRKKSFEDVVDPEVNFTILNKEGINSEYFFKNFEKLVKTWWRLETCLYGDSPGKRFVHEFLFHDLQNPLKLAIVADDIKIFTKYEKKFEYSQQIFELCCLCGSKNILFETLLLEDWGMINLKLSEDALAYALSNGEPEFALKLSAKAKEIGRNEAGPLFSYIKDIRMFDTIEKIEEIFRKE